MNENKSTTLHKILETLIFKVYNGELMSLVGHVALISCHLACEVKNGGKKCCGKGLYKVPCWLQREREGRERREIEG